MKRRLEFNSNRMTTGEKWAVAGTFALGLVGLLLSIGVVLVAIWAVIELVGWVTAQ